MTQRPEHVTSPQHDTSEHTRWNFLFIVMEASAFMTGMASVDPVAVLPLFIHALTPSTVIIGLVTTLQRLGYTLPQLPMAAILGHRPARLPYLRWGVFFGRFPFILFVIYLWTRGVENSTLTLAFMIVGFVAASLVFSFILSPSLGAAAVSSTLSLTKSLRGWFFCLSFVGIGLETKFSELMKVGGTKAAGVYIAAQLVNIVLVYFLAWFFFGGIFFPAPL